MFYNKSIHIKRSKLGARFGNFRFHSRACVKTFLGKSAFRKRRRQFFRGYYAPVPIPGPPFSSFDQGCAWIFDRRARPQWEICTAKRITDVFVRLVTMGGEVDSSRFLDSGWIENLSSASFVWRARDGRCRIIRLAYIISSSKISFKRAS